MKGIALAPVLAVLLSAAAMPASAQSNVRAVTYDTTLTARQLSILDLMPFPPQVSNQCGGTQQHWSATFLGDAPGAAVGLGAVSK